MVFIPDIMESAKAKPLIAEMFPRKSFQLLQYFAFIQYFVFSGRPFTCSSSRCRLEWLWEQDSFSSMRPAAEVDNQSFSQHRQNQAWITNIDNEWVKT